MTQGDDGVQRDGATQVDPAMTAVAASLYSARIMMVDDEPITLDVVQAYLEDAGYSNFVTLSEPAEAVAVVGSDRPDALLLDLMMPGVSGFDILKEIRADPRFQYLPVIVLTSSTDSETKLRALEMGATDFLAKPVDASELVLRLRNTLAAKAYQDRLSSLDRLTGLYNRQTFGDHIDWALRLAQRHGRIGALLHINIDRFKKINEALGPALGDEFLRAVALRLEIGVRDSDVIARIGEENVQPRLSRLGGDEFAVLLVEVDKTDRVAAIAARFMKAMNAPFVIGGHEVFMTCSIGIAVYPDDGTERDVLVQRAASALRAAKAQGGNTYSFYSASLNDRALHTLNLHSQLHQAVARGELRLYLQPKIDCATGAIAAAEALVRWIHPTRGFVSPGEFIPLAEETGLIIEIGDWILHESCRQIQAWLAAGIAPRTIAVNISGRQFGHRGFLESVRAILEQYPFDRDYLQFELTETILMGDAQENIQLLNDIKALGVRLSLDYFGTAYSSLSYLTRYPLDELKIDQSFVRDLHTEGKGNT